MEGLHKRQVKYFGTVKLTNKQEGNQHQQASEIKQRPLTEADQKHRPKNQTKQRRWEREQKTNPNAIKGLPHR